MLPTSPFTVFVPNINRNLEIVTSEVPVFCDRHKTFASQKSVFIRDNTYMCAHCFVENLRKSIDDGELIIEPAKD